MDLVNTSVQIILLRNCFRLKMLHGLAARFVLLIDCWNSHLCLMNSFAKPLVEQENCKIIPNYTKIK